MNSLDLMQKARDEWEVEGDENSKFFYGLINSRRKYQSIHARTFILINGSPTSEFSLKRDLRQGDPLSHFLFIIVMEGLHMALNNGIASNMFHGVRIVKLSPWLHVLVMKQARLSGWKANLLSIGGRLTLIKSVIESLGICYFSIFKAPEMVIKSLESLRANFFWGSHESSKKLSWVKWSNTLASFDKGGLGVGSLSAFNKALLLKWRWRLFNFLNSLWVQVIKAFHGNEACVDLGGCQTSGTWAKIMGTINHLYSSSVVPLNSIRFKIRDGSSIRFWKDTWLGNDPLYIKYNRLFHLENNKDCFISQRILNGL
uniref:Reverse transcriptase domain, reverse transcriptase zinc-binding domain protein n=1 Tax=Tanacetum cinerariifolium TaxID=118510 RepID=A0A6L2KQ41_TANCI|nr:reverse transcriptase domain, reverse transcriptase zinc-binding domain protein [Tanacetum cinerariifolium]